MIKEMKITNAFEPNNRGSKWSTNRLPEKINKFTTVVRDFNTPFSITDSYISSVINYIYSKIKGLSLYLIFLIVHPRLLFFVLSDFGLFHF